MKLMNLGLRAKIISAGVAPMVLVAILSAAGLYSVGALLSSIERVDNSNQAMQGAMQTEKHSLDMQTGMRGYLLTGDESFLTPYTDSEQSVLVGLSALKAKVRDEADQVKLLAEAEGVIKEWKRTSAEPMIALRREIGEGKDMNDLAALVAQGMGKTYFDGFRELINDFISRKQAILEARRVETINEGDIQRVRKAFESVDQTHIEIAQALALQAAAVEMDAGLRGYLLTGRDEYLDPFNSGRRRVFALLTRQAALSASDPDLVQLLKQMEQVLKEWLSNVAEPQIDMRRKIAQSKTMADLRPIISKGDEKRQFDTLRRMLSSFKAKEDDLQNQRKNDAGATAENTRKVLMLGTLLVLGAVIVVSYFLSGTITRPLREAAEVSEAISRGDLSRSLRVKSNDEVGRLGASFNAMLDSLREQTRQTLEGINVLGSSASEISATAAQLSASTAKTSSAMTETTTTVEEVKHSSEHVRDQAKKVAEEALQAVTISESGKQATGETINRMNLIKEQMESIGETVVRLSEHSQAIERAIEVVQDLADQSNLLAVNASIEAARAGDQGKGFAVVAHEIKSLADQSKEATEQVRGILHETRKWVSVLVMASEQGEKAVNAGLEQSVLAGQSIESLAGTVNVSAQSAATIEASCDQQNVGVDQVASAMGNIEVQMQQNLSGASQLEGAARKLTELGDRLKEMVAHYRL